MGANLLIFFLIGDLRSIIRSSDGLDFDGYKVSKKLYSYILDDKHLLIILRPTYTKGNIDRDIKLSQSLSYELAYN